MTEERNELSRSELAFRRTEGRALRRLLKDQMPANVSIEPFLYYSDHTLVEDFKGFESCVAASDIIVPELFAWTDTHFKVFNEVSQGNISPVDALPLIDITPDMPKIAYTAQAILLNTLYGSHKPVTFTDIRSNQLDRDAIRRFDPLDSRIDKHVTITTFTGYELRQTQKGGLTYKITHSLDESIHKMREKEKGWAEIHKQRDMLMARNIPGALASVIKSNDYGKDSGVIHPLFVLGPSHDAVGDIMRRSGLRVFDNRSEGFELSQEIEIQHRLREGLPVSNVMLAQILLEGLMHPYFDDTVLEFSKNSQDWSRYYREFCRTFSMSEIQTIWNDLTADGRHPKAVMSRMIQHKMTTQSSRYWKKPYKLDG